MRILWVEDNLDEVIALVDTLHFCGHSIMLLDSAAKAVNELAKGSHWDLVLLDSYMPGEGRPSHSGCTLFTDLRGGVYGEWGVKVPVCFVTGYGRDVMTIVSGVEPPPLQIFRKPVIVEDFLRELTGMLKDFAVEMKEAFGHLPNIHINFSDILKNIGNPSVSAVQKVDIDIDISTELPMIQKDFRDLKKEVAELDANLKEELKDIEEDLLSVTPNSGQGKINKAINKLSQFLGQLADENSKFHRIIKTTEKGIELAQQTAKTYNKFGQWLGLPKVPDLFLGET